jgi:hypothetical protein
VNSEVEHHSGQEHAKAALVLLAEILSEDLGLKLLAVVTCDYAGKPAIIAMPGHEATVMRYCASLDWKSAQRTAEEHIA